MGWGGLRLHGGAPLRGGAWLCWGVWAVLGYLGCLGTIPAWGCPGLNGGHGCIGGPGLHGWGVNVHGATVPVPPPQKPERDAWGSALEALEAALQLEKSVNQALLDLHRLAAEKGDPHVSCSLPPCRVCLSRCCWGVPVPLPMPIPWVCPCA